MLISVPTNLGRVFPNVLIFYYSLLCTTEIYKGQKQKKTKKIKPIPLQLPSSNGTSSKGRELFGRYSQLLYSFIDKI